MGRVLVEALSHGLPCVAHGYPIAREVLGPHGTFADLRVPGALAAALAQKFDLGPAAQRARHAWAHEHYAWETLAPRYVELVRRVAA
jgi:1,2-diacylglycerol 3-alpha-glucosyltransferase